MTTNQPATEQLQRAVTFFQQAGLERLLQLLRTRYIELGSVAGQVQLRESTLQERRELASLLEKPPYRQATIPIKLTTIDEALRRSSFNCSLPELLQAFFPNQPLITRTQQRADHTSHQEQFRANLQTLALSLPINSSGALWLLQGQHGSSWLFARYKNASAHEQQQQLATIQYIATLLNQLPNPAAPERLGLFAQRTSGDPHNLDQGRPAGRLFLQALADLADPDPNPSSQGRIQDVSLYQSVGLLVDTISSNVAVFHLTTATLTNGASDPLIAAAGPRILLLPLCQLTQWQAITSAGSAIYVIENPQVFEEVVASLASPQIHPHIDTQIPPTVICTAGWPSVAALTLLDLLLATTTTTILHYSGDFDLKGLQIATSLMERYPDRCLPWHIDITAYLRALQADGLTAPDRDLAQLTTLPPIFSSLTTAMLTHKKWAYQEGIAQLLITDVLNTSATTT